MGWVQIIPEEVAAARRSARRRGVVDPPAAALTDVGVDYAADQRGLLTRPRPGGLRADDDDGGM